MKLFVGLVKCGVLQIRRSDYLFSHIVLKMLCTSCDSVFNHNYKSTYAKNMHGGNHTLKSSMFQQKLFKYYYFGTSLIRKHTTDLILQEKLI